MLTVVDGNNETGTRTGVDEPHPVTLPAGDSADCVWSQGPPLETTCGIEQSAIGDHSSDNPSTTQNAHESETLNEAN